ncbi:MAG: hypothetical protein GY731_03750, partial [Gammaproteobacteria bacterium]|nr:hypothetical protein [Gammaproteobacteria bacterium]
VDGGSLPAAANHWPLALTPYLSSRHRLDENRSGHTPSGQAPKILQPSANSQLSSAHGDQSLPAIKLDAVGGQGRLIWMDNGRPITTSADSHFRFAQPGRHRLTVMDSRGRYDFVDLLVLGES